MNANSHIETYIDQRIRRIARIGAGTARKELREHVLEAAAANAKDQPMAIQHVERAFAALGTDEQIRQAFFPAATRVKIRMSVFAILIAASAAVAVTESFVEGGATCSVEGQGNCTASTSGFLFDALAWAIAPLLALAAFAWVSLWAGLAVIALFDLVAVARLANELQSLAIAELVLLSAAIAAGVAAWLQYQSVQQGHAATVLSL